MMRNAITVFNEWAEKNKDTGMEKGHSASVEEMLKHALKEREKIGDFFSFLDLGCGNGWVVRKVAKNNLCEKAMGVDGSKKMIAKARAIKPYCEYFLANIDSLKTSQKFDLIHSMEVLYYLDSPEECVNNVSTKWLANGGRFIAGIDHYFENKSSHSWEKKVGTPIMMRKETEWLDIFTSSGLVEVQSWRANKSEDWAGTLVLTGKKE